MTDKSQRPSTGYSHTTAGYGGMHIRCPHCKNPVDMVDDNPRTLLTCSSCGSSFSLLSSTDSIDETRLFQQSIGHFELLDQVGSGHFGTVWKARDTELDRIVAVKIPRRGQLTGTEAELFLREARAAAQLKHPNIISTHEVGRTSETIYIVSDFIQGANLGEWLAVQKLMVREAVQLCVKIARALHHAHTAGIVHRDLKPSNIMVDLDGAPHLMDFGLAKREAGEITMTRDGQVLGTPAYMSPEQAIGKGHEADRRTDIYSLGVILFELLTGERPFRGDERMLILQIISTEAPSPRKLNSRIPRDIETICLKCLEKDPNKRYPTAEAVAEDLERWLKEEPILARPISRIARGWRWCKRNKLTATLTAAILCLLLVGAIGGTTMAIIAQQNAQEASNNAARAREWAERAEGLLASSKRSSYSGQISAATEVWRRGSFAQARDVLELCDPDLRGWEHAFLTTMTQDGTAPSESSLRLPVFAGPISQIAFLKDSRNLVCASNPSIRPSGEPAMAVGRIRIVNVETGDAFDLQGHAGGVTSIAVSPNGTHVVSCGADRALKCWDVASRREEFHVVLDAAAASGIAYSPLGDRLVVCGENEGGAAGYCRIYDAETGQEQVNLSLKNSTNPALDEFRGISKACFTPDGQQVVGYSRSDRSLAVWNAVTGKVDFDVPLPDSRYPTRLIRQMTRLADSAMQPDGTNIIFANSQAIWDLNTVSRQVKTRGHVAADHVAISHNAKRVISGGYDTTIKIWDAESGEQLCALDCQRPSSAVAFSPDGNRIASADLDGAITIWDADGKLQSTIAAQRFVDLLYAKYWLKSDVIAKIEADQTLADERRAMALTIAKQRPVNAGWLKTQVLQIVKQRALAADRYAFALRCAESATEAQPDNEEICDTLGAAQYRAERYADAIATLTRRDKSSRRNPFNGNSTAAFLPMAHYQLGQVDVARTVLHELQLSIIQHVQVILGREPKSEDLEFYLPACFDEAVQLIGPPTDDPVAAPRPKARRDQP